MLNKPNPRIKNLYSGVCDLHSEDCVILEELEEYILDDKIKHIHILNADNKDNEKYFDNLSNTIVSLEVFNLNHGLTNLPFGLEKLRVISYQSPCVKVPNIKSV